MSKIKLAIVGLLTVPVLSMGAVASLSTGVGAVEGVRSGLDATKTEGAPEELDGTDGLVTKVVNILLYVIGIVSVIMIIIGGIMYATSSGAAEKVKNAKNTILYSVVGLVIAIFAYAIINWVLGNVTNT